MLKKELANSFNVGYVQELNKAQPTNLSYAVIKKIALHMNEQVGLNNINNFKKIIEKMGGKIIIDSNSFNNPMMNYLEFKNISDFNIIFPQGLSEDLERFLLAKILGHFVLHAKNGKNPCYFHKIGNDLVDQEGFWFATALLIDDAQITKKIYEGKSWESLASEFNVPEFAIKGKCKILQTLYLNEK